METKKVISKFTKKLDERRFMNTYGKVFIVDLFKLSFIACLIIPMVDVLIIRLAKKYNKELYRIDITN